MINSFAFYVVLAIGLAARMIPSVLDPNYYRPDEIFQNLEPAYRLLAARGIIPWEWRLGIRSWVFPGFLAAIFRSSEAVGLGAYKIQIVYAVLSIVALAPVGVGYSQGFQKFGWSGALICSALCVAWPDLTYFGPKPLGETQAGNLLIIALALAASRSLVRDRDRAWKRDALLGFTLGLIFDIRFHLGPVLLLIAAWNCRGDFRHKWLPFIAGAAIPVLASGALDWVSWGTPFQSVWKNFWINVVEGRSLRYGVAGPLEYLVQLRDRWGTLFVPMLTFFVIGFSSAPLFGWTAIAVIATHSLLAHKELSFIYAAIPPFLIVAGLGISRLIAAIPFRMSRVRVAVPIGVAGLIMTGVLLVVAPRYRTLWANGRAYISAMTAAASAQDICGLGLYGENVWGLSGGYTWFARDVPMLMVTSVDDLAIASTGFNYVMYVGPNPLPSHWSNTRCWAGVEGETVCLARSDTKCEEQNYFDVNRELEREDR